MIADAWNDPDYEDKEGARLAQARSMLGVPLLRDGQLIGAFALARRAPIPFTDRQVDLVPRLRRPGRDCDGERGELLGRIARTHRGLAQRNSEFGEQIEQQSATIDVLKVMSSTPDDAQPVFELIVRRAQELCKGVGASLIELEGNLVHFRATHSPASHTNDPAAVEAWKALFPMVPTLEWLSCRAILEKREVHIRDLQADPGLSDIVRATNSDIRSHLTIPLMRDGQAIGSISLRGKEPGGFTDSQVVLLRTFAEQAVIAIGSVANFRALRERTAELGNVRPNCVSRSRTWATALRCSMKRSIWSHGTASSRISWMCPTISSRIVRHSLNTSATSPSVVSMVPRPTRRSMFAGSSSKPVNPEPMSASGRTGG